MTDESELAPAQGFRVYGLYKLYRVQVRSFERALGGFFASFGFNL